MKFVYVLIGIFCSTFLGIFFFIHFHTLSKQPSQIISVYIAPSFPLYTEYRTYFSASKSFTLTNSAANAQIAIDTSVSHHILKIPVYNRVDVLVQNFQHQDSTITLQAMNDPIKRSNIAVDTSIAASYPTFTTTADPLTFVHDMQNYAIIPFTKLTNMYRTIVVNNESPIDKNFNETNYPLKEQYFLYTTIPSIPHAVASFIAQHAFQNYDHNAIHTVILTGTTALARGEYFEILKHGVDYPITYIKDIMHTGDIVHVSNETSFNPSCTQHVGTLQFCALPSFIHTLIDAGVNLVELTGNHNNDYGAEYNLQSMQLYDQYGIKYFGGGMNEQDAHNPAIIKLGNTTFAFLGYNQPGPSYAFASPTTAGAAKLDSIQMVNDIKKAKSIADVVVVDVQWENENNQYPTDSQIALSRMAIDAGADIVSGSQAHRPEGMEFYHGKIIMYGLGNLLFDQMENLDTRQNVIVKHTFYNNTLVSTNFTPTLLFSYSQPHLATGADAQAILDQIFQASTNLP